MTKARPAPFGPDATETGAVVSWEGADRPITLTVHGPDGEVSTPLTPVRGLELAQELIQPAVVSIKTAQWGDTRGRARAAPQRDLRPGESRVPTEAAIDPKAAKSFRKIEQGARRDYDQRFWWRPGTTLPRRGPDLGAMVP